MRWFTFDWAWKGEDESDPWPAYRRHFDELRPRMTVELVELLERVPLHDANLRDVIATDASVSLTLAVLDDDNGRHRVDVRYQDASLRMISDPARGTGGPHGFGDLGYDEIDIESDGRWIHRILFSSGIELEVRFRAVSLSR
jgi:hypothetical protein